MRHIENVFFKALEALLVFLLAAMVLMVFGNVLMRWFLNDGIQISEEMSRYCFVWLTFIGAVVVARENAHLGVDALTRTLGSRGRLICMVDPAAVAARDAQMKAAMKDPALGLKPPPEPRLSAFCRNRPFSEHRLGRMGRLCCGHRGRSSPRRRRPGARPSF